jgi:hypothetical protein
VLAVDDFLENATAIFKFAGLLFASMLLLLWPLIAFAALSVYFRNIIVFLVGVPVELLWFAFLISLKERVEDEVFKYWAERRIEKWKAWAQSRVQSSGRREGVQGS